MRLHYIINRINIKAVHEFYYKSGIKLRPSKVNRFKFLLFNYINVREYSLYVIS